MNHREATFHKYMCYMFSGLTVCDLTKLE